MRWSSSEEDVFAGINAIIGQISREARVPLEAIKNVSVIGAGIMGQGIAHSISAAGLDVLIVEKNEDHINAAKENLASNLKREISRWAMTESEMKSILSRIKWSVDMNSVKTADIIIESVEENFQLKRLIFKKLDEIAKPDTIFVSNTSTLSLTKTSEIMNRSDKIIGMHFLNPVPKVPLVELIRGMDTSDATVKIAKEFASKIGKTAVEVYEYPGFVTTRAIVPLLNEAMYILLLCCRKIYSLSFVGGCLRRV